MTERNKTDQITSKPSTLEIEKTEKNTLELNKTEIVVYSSTPYDDVYRTLVNDCPGLIIPVVNEVFGKNHRAEEEITILNNEIFLNRQNGNQLERVTDSNFRIEGQQYHIECQSTVDGSILIRIFEYDAQIALKDAILTTNNLHVRFPNTAILYLRHNKNTPDSMKVSIEVPGGFCTYKVPVMKVQCYSIGEIFEKKLYFLIPFYIFTYENDFKEYDSNEEKLQELTDIYTDLMERLNQVTREGIINEVIKGTITDMSKKVLIHISKQYSNVKEKVGAIMGGQILEYETKTIYKNGIKVGVETGEDKVSKLYELLIQDGRRDEMEKALKDKQLRRRLMHEYGLTEKIE